MNKEMSKLPFNTIRDPEPAKPQAPAPVARPRPEPQAKPLALPGYDKHRHNYRVCVFREGIAPGKLEYSADEWQGARVTGVNASNEAKAVAEVRRLIGDRAFVMTRG